MHAWRDLTRASGRPIRMTRVRGTQSQSRRRPFSHILLYLRSHRLVPLGCAQLRPRFVYTIVFQMSTLQKLVFPVNSREKANNSRISPRHPYIDDRLAPAPDSPKIPKMRFTPQFLDELRARLPVSEVVGKRVKLKKAGREWKGLSPFQQEKALYFFVNDQKQAWFDFSSGKNGNIFDFLVQTEGLSFPEAVERLAAMAGVALPTASPDAARQEQRRKTLHDVMELAAKFFADTLASRNGADARGYLGDRAISPAVQLQFRIGYAASERFALKEHLGSQGIPVEDMVEAGLLVSGDDIPVPYDRFRDRVMFPITDIRGRVIAFGGRALEKDVAAKYLNSPETPLFHKGDNLYDLARSGGRGAIEEVIGAARGLADVIWSREIEAGTFATPERRAALEARIGELTNGIRDEVVRRYYRQDLSGRLQRTFAPEVPRGGYAKGGYRGGGNFGGESGRRFAPRGAFTLGAPGRFGRQPGCPSSPALNRGPYQASSPQLALRPIMRGQRSAISRREALILQSLINHPWLLHDHLEEVAALELAHPEAHKLRAGIISAFANDHHHAPEPSEQAEKIRADLDAAGFSQSLQRVERAITTSAVWGAQSGAARDDVLSTWHQLVSLHRQWHSLLRELKDAELALGEEASEANLSWLRDVKARLEEVDGTEALIEGFGESSGRFQRSV